MQILVFFRPHLSHSHRALADITHRVILLIECAHACYLHENVDIFKSCMLLCTRQCNLHPCRCTQTGRRSCMEALFFMLLCTPEDKTGTEGRTAICMDMLQLIISIISSSGRRSANVWHVSASVDMRQSRLNEWWNEARWEKNKTASWEKKKGNRRKNRNPMNVRQSHRRVHHFTQ